jgi:hypothetical protein
MLRLPLWRLPRSLYGGHAGCESCRAGPADPLEATDTPVLRVLFDTMGRFAHDTIPVPGLAWHSANTEAVVRQSVQAAIDAGHVTHASNYSPPKDAINGIIYDLTISYDADTGKYVGSYHCNPVVSEV